MNYFYVYREFQDCLYSISNIVFQFLCIPIEYTPSTYGYVDTSGMQNKCSLVYMSTIYVKLPSSPDPLFIIEVSFSVKVVIFSFITTYHIFFDTHTSIAYK